MGSMQSSILDSYKEKVAELEFALGASLGREAKLRAALVALDEYYSLPGEDDWVRFLNEVLTPAREVLRQTAEELK
jgi:hypothetical protein